MKFEKILAAIFIAFCANYGQCQDIKQILTDTLVRRAPDTIARIELLAEYRDGSMYLRWAPNKSLKWYESIPFGYKVERFDYNETTGLMVLDSRDTAIVEAWKKEKYQEFALQNPKKRYHLAMAEAIYGDVTRTTNARNFGLVPREIDNKYGVAVFAADMDFGAGKSGGLAYQDANVDSGKSYFYRVTPLLKDTLFEPGYLTVKAEEEAIPKPFIIAGIESESKVILQWWRDDHEPFFSGYFIEVSNDNISWSPINEMPFVGGVSKEFPSDYFSFSHKVENYQPSYYRIIGITPFGIKSEPSQSVRLQGKDRTSCDEISNLKLVPVEINKEVKLSWDPVDCGDLKGYQVLKGKEPEGEFRQIGSLIRPSDNPNYVDKLTSTKGKMYYKIATLDTANNVSITLPRLVVFRDTMPPAIPTGLKGNIDTNGIVTVTWNPVTDEDLRGYHIYRANADYHMYTMVNPHPLEKPIFKDTIPLRVLTEEIFYKVTSVDYQGHLSSFSVPIRLTKPDKVRPFPPSIVNYDILTDHVSISWLPSRSKDLVGHKMFKKTNNEIWTQLHSFDDKSGHFEDYDVRKGQLYTYKIIAIDDAGLESVDHATVHIKFIDQDLPKEVEIISCTKSDNGDHEVSWHMSRDDKFKRIIIYRSINGGPLTVVGRESNKNSFTDTTTREGNQYAYALKHEWINGKKSDFSELRSPINN